MVIFQTHAVAQKVLHSHKPTAQVFQPTNFSLISIPHLTNSKSTLSSPLNVVILDFKNKLQTDDIKILNEQSCYEGIGIRVSSGGIECCWVDGFAVRLTETHPVYIYTLAK